MEPFLRNTTNASKFDQRVHETETDSSVGETVAANGVHLASLSDGPRLAKPDFLSVSGRFLPVSPMKTTHFGDFGFPFVARIASFSA
jgi:hypothetical protein